ncbi:RNA polymerase II subunit A C-terminal domain phosphatase SSU72 [Thamnocephalis sphaerospora]|uniref:RNA polymerase II subunit A C-terminal domain phosphatase SSU72 n=1 Tax=Thamnocephalis sphaerospora TaxID=78915 RepID=A0A4P9XVG5_9FUNG|nr:RNA polymerase II subunit A C-terminal domain phosphatase SSU72 [Thamnocephalis sphaerospora]|eukprot:RKP09400.1 RNA polymerase II subunit A C-terminal domain phosphatase SSU72 [Thamnocephalis sphaerospora]
MVVTFAVVCSSNNNRSMEAHCVLRDNGFQVNSFGTGNMVRLPGTAQDRPNNYKFGTPYEQMYTELKSQDENYYGQRGILKMLDRNRRIKLAPERFQESKKHFDVVISCEERVFDAICEELMMRGGEHNRPVHIVNVEIRDNHEDAAVGGQQILDLANMIVAADDMDESMQDILEKFQQKYGDILLHSVSFY